MIDINAIKGAIPFNGESILEFGNSENRNNSDNLLNWQTLAVAGLAVYLISEVL